MRSASFFPYKVIDVIRNEGLDLGLIILGTKEMILDWNLLGAT